MNRSIPQRRRPQVQRQHRLPMRKVVEIAWKQIRMRLARSLLVTSGIVLAIAFLISIQINDAFADGMRARIAQTQQHSTGPVMDDRQAVLVKAHALEAKLSDNGVPTRPDEIAAAKLQTRWLLGLALLVAFVGILNAMLMSVTERFREIGTMKCLGALDSFIVKLFLVESLFQGIVGTAIGLLVGGTISTLLNLATYGTLAFANFQTASMLSALGLSALVGVVLTVAGAVGPAWQAARMHPIEAMRVEA